MSSKLKSFLMKAAFVFEPIAAPFISYYLKRPLSDWKKEEKLDNYRIQTTRIKKFHYTITVDIDLTPQQSQRALHQFVWTLNKKLRR